MSIISSVCRYIILEVRSRYQTKIVVEREKGKGTCCYGISEF